MSWQPRLLPKKRSIPPLLGLSLARSGLLLVPLLAIPLRLVPPWLSQVLITLLSPRLVPL
jgi:hypothetical protein